MNKKQKTILKSIFKDPIKSNVKWTDIELFFKYLGAEISEGNGSRVRVVLNRVKAVFHRPHPRKETDKGALVSVRRFLENAGIKNDEI
ncbi:type II toxin-antitoxin system HicA family toxin [Candidatus Babeliales bacterium]|nr:type II toxin-antitoxin system HicA family toxin [Candidatus Babeliales bacterium]MCF7899709.1 type II toxin-antitoxin system HicA family toxin [Candidatus Babeliales bacterium]